MSIRSRIRGFTLLEVMIGLALLGLALTVARYSSIWACEMRQLAEPPAPDS